MCMTGLFGFTVLFHFVRKVWVAFYFHLSWEKRKAELCHLLQNEKNSFPQLCLSLSACLKDSMKLQCFASYITAERSYGLQIISLIKANQSLYCTSYSLEFDADTKGDSSRFYQIVLS